MAFKEYPKALYKRGEYKEVASFEAEESARDDGFDDWAHDYERMQEPADAEQAEKPRRGRPPKVKAEG